MAGVTIGTGEAVSGRDMPAPHAWRSVFILMTFFVLSYVDRYIISLLVVPIQRDLAISDSQFGLLQGFAFAVVFGIAGFPFGWLVDRVPRRLMLFVAVLLWSAGTAASGLSHDFTQLLLSRYAVAMGEAVLAPAVYSLVADIFPKRQLASALGVYNAGSPIGSGLGLVIGGLVFAFLGSTHAISYLGLVSVQPWQAALLTAALPGFAMAFLVFLVPEPKRRVPEDHVSPAPEDAPKIGAFLRGNRRVLLCHYLGFALIVMTAIGVGAWSPAYIGRHFGWETHKIGQTLGLVICVCGTIATVTGGRIADRLLRAGYTDAYFRLPMISGLIGGMLGIAAFLVPNPWACIALLGAMQLCINTFLAPCTASLQVIAPPHLRGQVSSLYLLTGTLLGNGLGPTLIGWLTDHVYHDRALVGTSVVTMVAVAAPVSALLLNYGRPALMRAMAAAGKR
jgi:MFS family permease